MWFDNHTHYYVLLAIERFNVLGEKEELFIKKKARHLPMDMTGIIEKYRV